MGRYFRRRKGSRVMFLPAIANINAPTRAEITAGVNLTPQIAEIDGFSFSNDPIATPDLGSSFDSTIPGVDTAENPSLTIYDDDASVALRTSLAKDASGFVVLMPYGDVPTKRCEVWPVTSTGVNDEWTVGNEAARFTVAFAVTSTPSQNAVIPA